ncbi:TrbC/VIRB2 family protein [Giesbergeria anulus]|uniref:TrbC/VIRB2 family protein n=1 Tax=Giesbergeria anulus TaxID=180197 RepID=A0A1H9NFM6_9BURK|nr:TrbC/VIRB2 family protein [Giesbergeria anulus]
MVLKMENIKLTTFSQNSFSLEFPKISPAMKFLALIFLTLFLGTDAMAQNSGSAATGLCNVASFMKTIVTGAAIIAVLIFVANSFFVKSSIVGDLVMYVMIGCAIATAAVYIVQQTGLTSSCSLSS